MSCTEKLVTPVISHLTQKDFENIYEPAEDSFLFLDALEAELTLIRSLQPTICIEIGCGSGIISSGISRALGSCFTIACDINPLACVATRETAARNNTQVESVQMDLCNMLRMDQQIDLLLFNPPYVVTSSEEVVQPFMTSGSMLHRAWAGGNRGREVIDRILPLAHVLLSPKCLFYLVVIKENDPKDIASVMTKEGFITEIVKSRKIRGEHLSVMKFQRGFDPSS